MYIGTYICKCGQMWIIDLDKDRLQMWYVGFEYQTLRNICHSCEENVAKSVYWTLLKRAGVVQR